MNTFEDIIKKHFNTDANEKIEKVNHQLEEDRIDNIENSCKASESIDCVLIHFKPEALEENIECTCNALWNTFTLKEKLYILDKVGYTLSI